MTIRGWRLLSVGIQAAVGVFVAIDGNAFASMFIGAFIGATCCEIFLGSRLKMTLDLAEEILTELNEEKARNSELLKKLETENG